MNDDLVDNKYLDDDLVDNKYLVANWKWYAISLPISEQAEYDDLRAILCNYEDQELLKRFVHLEDKKQVKVKFKDYKDL